MQSDPLLSLQEQAEVALRDIRSSQGANPMYAAQVGMVQATGMLINIVAEMTASLSVDEAAVVKEATAYVTQVLEASLDAVRLTIE